MISKSVLRLLLRCKFPCKELKMQKPSHISLPSSEANFTTLPATFFHTTAVFLRKENFNNSKGPMKQSVAKPVLKKIPFWMANMHSNLMKSVSLPPRMHGNNVSRHIESNFSTDTPSELLALASSIQDLDRHRDKIVFALCRNFGVMSVEEILIGADVLYMNGVNSPVYKKAMVTYLYEMIDTLQLKPSQIVRTVFHIQQAWPSSSLLLIELEGKMKERLSDFTINEVAHVCHLLFYGQYRFKSMLLVDEIGKKLLNELDALTPEYLPMMMKAFRYSNYVKVSFYKELGDRLVSSQYVCNFSNAGQIMHFAFAFASVHITHHELFKQLLRRILELKQPPRMKDLSKLVWACGTLVTTDQEHLEKIQAIVDTVRGSITEQQVLRYPDNLMDFLVGLAYLNIYPLDLIDHFVVEETIQVLLGLDAGRTKFLQLQFLDASLAIECPEYKRNLLTKQQHHVVERHLEHFSVDVDIKLRKPITPALEALRDEIGTENVQCCFVLPHFKTADILLAYDQDKQQFIPPPESSDDMNFDKVTRIVIMLLSKAQTSYDDQPLGMLQCKLRQLHKLGYSIVQIQPDEALAYTLMSKVEIQQQLLNHLSRAVGHSLTD